MQRGTNPSTLLEWSRIIERLTREACHDTQGERIRFKGTIDKKGDFGLDFTAADWDAFVGLLESIQRCLTSMPTSTRQFYASVMVALAQNAEQDDGASKP